MFTVDEPGRKGKGCNIIDPTEDQRNANEDLGWSPVKTENAQKIIIGTSS